MFEVELNWPCYLDGVESAKVPNPYRGLFADAAAEVPGYRARTDRTRVTARRLDIGNAVSIRLANIYAPVGKKPVEDREREFLHADGFPTDAPSIDRTSLRAWASMTGAMLASAVSEPSKALAAIDGVLQVADSRLEIAGGAPSGLGLSAARMSLDVTMLPGGERERPKTILRPRTLRDFVLLEVATVACTKGMGMPSCDYCGRLFLTGPGTGRRSTSRFCGDLHRVYSAQGRPGGLATKAEADSKT